jgi:membrane protease YdiL (CAAX protease family)
MVTTVILAFALWFVTFAIEWGSFWVKISISAATLAVVSIAIQRGVRAKLSFDAKSIVIGVVSAAVLYGIFVMGKIISTQLFDFAGHQIDGIYGLGEGSNLWLIAVLLFFVTGPSEELYWRGYLQRGLSQRLGGAGGYVAATALYAAVHLWTLNFMLVGAAAVAGAFWGLLYWRLNNLAPVIISHSIWSAVIFSGLRV